MVILRQACLPVGGLRVTYYFIYPSSIVCLHPFF
jgi:hypothetical protein